MLRAVDTDNRTSEEMYRYQESAVDALRRKNRELMKVIADQERLIARLQDQLAELEAGQ